MFKWFSNRKLIGFLLGIMLFVALMGLTVSERTQLTWPEKFLRDTIGWIQDVFHTPVAAVSGFFGEWFDILDVHEENRELRKSLNEFARDYNRLNQLEAENIRLQKALGFTDAQRQIHNYRYHYADVIANGGDNFNRSVIINVGENDGIRANMAVATVDGLVGRVSSVTKYHSSVQLLLDFDNSGKSGKPFACTVKGKEQSSFGIIEDYDQSSGFLRMTKIDPLDPLKTGDLVITSGLGELFPAGLVVGQVVKRKVGEFGITHVAIIKPTARFKQLREVFVVEVPVVR